MSSPKSPKITEVFGPDGVAKEHSIYAWSDEDLAMWRAVRARRQHDIQALQEGGFPIASVREVEEKRDEGNRLWLEYLRLKTKMAEQGSYLSPHSFEIYKNLPA